GSRNRSAPPGCPARCRSCGPDPNAAAPWPPGWDRRCGSTGRWESAASGRVPGWYHSAAWRADRDRRNRGWRMSAGESPGRGAGRESWLGVCAWSLSSGLMVTVGDEGDQLAGNMALAGLAEAGFVLLTIVHGARVLLAVEADAGVEPIVGDDQAEVLIAQLARGVLQQVLGCGGEADAEGPVRAPRERGEDVGAAHYLQEQDITSGG